MLLTEYVASLQEVLNGTPVVTATALSYEERPPFAGLIKGSLTFTDGSHLDFKEFVITQPPVSVIKYGYHYRLADGLIFRYSKFMIPHPGHSALRSRFLPLSFRKFRKV
jgi:hypothetical protein